MKQALISKYGLNGDGGTLLNKITSIGRARPAYQARIARGNQVLASIGYE